MGEFGINLGKAEQLAGRMESFETELRNYAERIEQVSQSLRSNHGISMEFLCDKINLQNEEVFREADKLSGMSSSLNSIVVKYAEAERKIAEAKSRKENDEVLKNLSQDYDRTTKTFDDDKQNGSYGADQGNMAHHKKGIWFFGYRWFEDEDLYAYIRSHSRYKNYSQTDIARLMNQINKEGCGYIAIVNNIFAEYEGREDEFQRRFGFPMYDKNGKANYDYLIVDFYANTDDKYFLNDPRGAIALVNDVILSYNGKEDAFRAKYGCDPITKDGRINIEAAQKILNKYEGKDIAELNTDDTTIVDVENRFRHNLDEKGMSYIAESKSDGTTPYEVENRFCHYLDEKGMSYECESVIDLDAGQIKEYINSGKNVNIATESFNLYNENGKVVAKDVGRHWMTITGVTEDGRYIVSSWGKRYYLNPSELPSQIFLVTDITAS